MIGQEEGSLISLHTIVPKYLNNIQMESTLSQKNIDTSVTGIVTSFDEIFSEYRHYSQVSSVCDKTYVIKSIPMTTPNTRSRIKVSRGKGRVKIVQKGGWITSTNHVTGSHRFAFQLFQNTRQPIEGRTRQLKIIGTVSNDI